MGVAATLSAPLVWDCWPTAPDLLSPVCPVPQEVSREQQYNSAADIFSLGMCM